MKAIVLITTWSPTASPVDVGADLDDLAGGLVAERGRALPGRDAAHLRCTCASDPQMPHARIRTSTSSGPATGCSTSTIPVVPGPVTMTAFIDVIPLSGDVAAGVGPDAY